MDSIPVIHATPDGPMVEGASPALLFKLLTILESEVASARAPLQGWLQPGLEPTEIVGRLAEVRLRAPEEVVTWFSWHNGYVDPPRPGSQSPLPNFPFASLETAISRYRRQVLDFQAPTGPSAPDPAVFEMGAGRGWLRLVDENYGLSVDCSGPPERPPRLHCASEDFAFETESVYRAVSLCTYVAWMISGIRDGGYKWSNETRRWHVDLHRLPEQQVAARFW